MERKRVLIAVNDLAEIEKFKQLLITSGFEVKVADNGVSAIALSRDFRPHVVMAELNLAKIDGHHLLRELKNQSSTQSVPFILISRHRSVNERVHSMSLGVDDYITLPFDPQETLARLNVIVKEVESFEISPQRNNKGFSGKLSEMNVIEILQILEIGKKSAVISVENGEDDGKIYVKNGEVFQASLGELPILNALFRMFIWDAGTFTVELKPVKQTGNLPETTESIVKKGFIYKDRWQRNYKNLPPMQTQLRLSEGMKPNEESSASEKSVLNLITGQSRLVDILNQSQLGDLKTIKVLSRLFQKNIIEEVIIDEPQESTSSFILNGNGAMNGQHLSQAILNFLNVHKDSLVRYKSNRKRNKSLVIEDEEYDSEQDKSTVYLKKSELLMIRKRLIDERTDNILSIN